MSGYSEPVPDGMTAILNPNSADAHALRAIVAAREASAAAGQAHQRKAASTAQARLALAGFELVQMADGSFVVARWGMVKSLADLAAVDDFLARVGA